MPRRKWDVRTKALIVLQGRARHRHAVRLRSGGPPLNL